LCFGAKEKKHNKKIKGEDGVEVEGEGAKAIVTNYFTSLFTPMAGVDTHRVLDAVTPRVTDQMNEFLSSDYMEDEVKKALNDMGDLKTLGADGTPAIFYKKF
jgi:hypothetical protein